MSESGIWDNVWVFILGIVVAVITDIIVRLLPIGENIRYSILFNWRKFTKWIRNAPIKAKYFNKTQNLENRKMSFDTAVDELQRILLQNDFVLKGKLGKSVSLSRFFGRTEINLTLSPSYETIIENEEEKLIISQIQAEYEIVNCHYRDFTGNLFDLLQVTINVEKNLRPIVGDWFQENLMLELKKLYEYTGVFSELKLSSLTGKMAGKYEISMSENQFVIYGKPETAMISMVKDIIAFYY